MNRKKSKLMFIILLGLLLIVISLFFAVGNFKWYNSKNDAYNSGRYENMPEYQKLVHVFSKEADNNCFMECKLSDVSIFFIEFKEKESRYRNTYCEYAPIVDKDSKIYQQSLELPLEKKNKKSNSTFLCGAIFGNFKTISIKDINPDAIYHEKTPSGRDVTIWFYENASDEIVNSKSEIVFKE